MRVFVVSGFSGTGKTTLVESIVKALVKSGHTVATIKSSIHEPGPEKGTDTWRHVQAGASVALFYKADNGHVKLKERISTDDMATLLEHDFLIIEGMKSVNVGRFWCVGDTDFNLDDIPANTHAIVTWSEKPSLILDIPVLTADSVDQLLEIVKIKALDISEIE